MLLAISFWKVTITNPVIWSLVRSARAYPSRTNSSTAPSARRSSTVSFTSHRWAWRGMNPPMVFFRLRIKISDSRCRADNSTHTSATDAVPARSRLSTISGSTSSHAATSAATSEASRPGGG